VVAPKSEEITPSKVIAATWILGKYAPERELGAFLRRPNVREVWRKSSWTARQVAAITPMLFETNQRWVQARLAMSGQRDALGVLANLWQLQSQKRLDKDKQLKMYLEHPPSPIRGYPFYKIVIARAVLDGDLSTKAKSELRAKVRTLARDKRYYRLLARKRPET